MKQLQGALVKLYSMNDTRCICAVHNPHGHPDAVVLANSLALLLFHKWNTMVELLVVAL